MTRLQVQEQAANSSGAPPDYEGRIELDPILLDVERLVTALETGVFELSNTVMDMVIFRTIFFELLVFFTFTILTFHFAY